MKTIKKTILPILIATIWISISEFVRNEFLLKSYWTDHYESMGLNFPSEPINGIIWGIWSLCFAISIYIFAKKFTLIQTTFIAWFVGFVFMWLVIGNLNVLPFGILPFAIPLSILEAFLASLIVKKVKI
ncbi:hypothetical protein [Lentimicrobium sp.]|uniref:hypothetical protein n=1 Tax=Lentimicrobium sp. TaxID=2034841 RepID=UPI002BC87BDB|nr:hypothetical protein [Lentimicrobium sp.]MCO5261709.1 hypothetical protein [Lentimicrobium sp.]HPJ63794.1 hypothetical protein [Lentimicrobium sp.]HPR27600.1 hypothetical protein [Lentimicrobium sp.]